MTDQVADALTTPCIACIAGEFPELCETRHTPSVVRLAEALGRSLAGPPGHPEAHPEWYIEDAAEIADDVSEGTGWVIEHDEGCLGEYFKVNGVEFWLEVNAEGYNPPVLAAEHRAELAEEESWNDEEL